MKITCNLALKFVLICGLGSLLFACASPAQMNAMIPDVTEKAMIDEKSPLAGAVELGAVSGGEETNPMWTSEVGDKEFSGALKNALASHALLAEEGGQYILTVEMQEMDQPIFGGDFTVTGTIKYTVVDTITNEVAFETVVKAPYTASFSDAYLGIERLRLANEGAARTNIGQFLEEFVNSPAFADQLSQLNQVQISEIMIIS